MKNSKALIFKRIFIIFITIIFILVSMLGLLILGFNHYHTKDYWFPNYPKIDLLPILEKENLSVDDYDILYTQTGITKIGIDSILEKNDINLILDIQEDFFTKFETYHHNFAPLLCAEMLEYNSPKVVPLEDGDIIISPTTHFSIFEFGHSALVVNGKNKLIINALNYSTPTTIDNASFMTDRPTFIVLRVKTDKQTRENVANFAKNNLLDIKYSIFAGAMYPKFSKPLLRTQCAHLIWYSYMEYGIDLDYNAGMIVMPKDIFKSKNVEVVQVYGLNPKNVWQ